MSLKWNPDFYKTGYEGFEAPQNFPDANALANYRQLLLEKTRKQADFIAQQMQTPTFSVIEFGSGNGRLIIELALRGLLKSGLGIEISKSRVAFAQQWASDLGLTNVQFVAADVLAFSDYALGAFDVAICITGAFGYFKPIRESAPSELLEKIHLALAPHGLFLLELYQLPEKRKQLLALSDHHLRLWQPLPAEDRFRFYLDDFEYDADQNLLKHEKIFIGRDGSIDAGRVEVIAYYTEAQIKKLLMTNGFEHRYSGADFDKSPYQENESQVLITLAQKKTVVS